MRTFTIGIVTPVVEKLREGDSYVILAGEITFKIDLNIAVDGNGQL